MALQQVIPSKHLGEVHQLVVDFSPLLLAGESILPLTVTIMVGLYSGIDGNASAILVPSPSIVGNVVSQGLQQGMIGVIYTLDVTATTNLSHVYHIESKLAVLPDDYPAAGNFISYYFTSQPYPIQIIDTMHWHSSIISCLVFPALTNYPLIDTTHWHSSIPSALVTSGLYPYILFDTTHWTSAINSAQVNTVLLKYTFSEATHWTSAIVSATVTTTLIRYAFTETTHWTSSIQSATVT